MKMTDTVVRADSVTEERDDIQRLIRLSGRFIGAAAPDVEPGVDVASWINVSRFVEASGDENPLYSDPRYGAVSAHHTMLAPPTFVLAVATPVSTGVLDLLQHSLTAALTALSLSWDDHIRLGDRLAGHVRISDVAHRLTPSGQERARVVSATEYRRDDVGFARGWAEVELAPADEATPGRPIQRYDPDEIQRMVHELDTETPPRGGVPRFWSEVAVGEAGPTLLKGPLNLADLMVWVFAEGRPVRAGNLQYARLARLEGRRATHPLTGWPVWDRTETALDSAVTDPAGPSAPEALLVTLAGQYVTHWMGDDAFLRQLSVRVHQPFRYGDALRLTGTVTDRFTASDGAGTRYHAVILRVAGRNQLDEPVADADAVVFLPERGKPVRLPVRDGLACDIPVEE